MNSIINVVLIYTYITVLLNIVCSTIVQEVAPLRQH